MRGYTGVVQGLRGVTPICSRWGGVPYSYTGMRVCARYQPKGMRINVSLTPRYRQDEVSSLTELRRIDVGIHTATRSA